MCLYNMRVMNVQSIKCEVCAVSCSECVWCRCRRLRFCDAVDKVHIPGWVWDLSCYRFL